MLTSGTEETPYYTNSTHLPVSFTDDIFEALEHQDDLRTLYTGGTVLLTFLGEQLNAWRQARQLVRAIARWIEGAAMYYLQRFVPQDALDLSLRTIIPYDSHTLARFARSASPWVSQIMVR